MSALLSDHTSSLQDGLTAISSARRALFREKLQITRKSVLVVVSPPLFLSTLLPFAQKTKRSCDSSGHEKKPVAHPSPLALPLSLDVDHARRRRVPRCCRLWRLGAVLLVAAIRLARAQTASSRVPSGWPAAAADSSAARACASSHIVKPGLVL